MSKPVHRAPFWEKVERKSDADCWPWLGYRKPSGHGLTSYKSTPMHASRKAWILTHGPIPADLCVNHRCDNPACCNPSHMYLGSRADNMVDLWNKTPAEERTFGRKRTLSPEDLERLWQLRRKGKKLRECAEIFDVHIATICRYITEVRKAKLAKIYADRLSTLRKSAV